MDTDHNEENNPDLEHIPHAHVDEKQWKFALKELKNAQTDRDTYRNDNIILETQNQTFKTENDKLADYAENQKNIITTLKNEQTNLIVANEKLNCLLDIKDKELRNAFTEGHRQGKLDVLEDENEKPRKYEIPLRKPDLFKQGQNFRRWLKSFNLFSKAARIHDSKKLDCLLTFLDEPSQSKIETLNLTPQQKTDFQECCELIERAIEGSNTKAEWRNKLFKCKQANNETITDFVTRLTDLADRCYGNESSVIKNQILLDCFLSGILSESIAFEIMKDNCTDYLTAYKKALDLEGIKACRRVNTINTDQNKPGRTRAFCNTELSTNTSP